MVKASSISKEVRDVLSGRIQSIEGLEILLLLRGERSRSWTPDAVSRHLGIAPASAAAILDRLCSANFLDVRIGESLRFRFAPGTQELERLAGEIARVYDAHRLVVIRHLTSDAEPQDGNVAIRSFAQAFRFKRRSDG